MNDCPNISNGKAIRRLAAMVLLAFLPAALPFLPARAESGGKESHSAPAQALETSLSAAVIQDSSAPQPSRFSHLTTTDGLSDLAMSGAVQDHQGFMWFGTERGGLNRYDGCEFKIYQNEEGNDRSLSRNNVTALLLDRQGTLWVGTGGGLCRYNRNTDDFTCYRHIPGDDTSLCDIAVTALCEDASGAIWVGTDNGLSRLDTKTGKFVTWRHDPKNPRSMSSNLIRSLFADPQGGRLWVGTVTDGACVLDPKTGEFTAYRPDPNVPGSIGGGDVTCFLRDKAGVLWVGNGGGLDRFEPETQTFVHHRHDRQDTNSLSDDYVWALYEDRAGRFWVCTPRGLNFMDRSRGIFTRILAAPNDPTSYCAASVNHVCEDNTGAVWATSHLHGVVRLPGEPEKFQVYCHDPNNTNTLRNYIVESIHVDRNNRAWIGTLGGLDYLDDCRPPVRHSIATDTHSVAEDARGRIWAGAFPQGLFRIQGDNVTHFKHDPNNPNSLASDQIWALATDDLDNLWIIYWAAGVGRFDGENFTHYTADPANPQRLPFNLIWGSAKDTNGFIWLAGNGGLTRLDPASAVFTTHLIDPEKPQNEINRTFMSVYIDRDSPGEMWVGTLSGLFQFDRASGKFTRRYTKKDGLPADNVQSIQRDNQGRLWVGTTVGLSRFDPAQGTFRNYDKSDGLPGNKFFVGAAAKASDGQMFFGNTDGLVAFYPDKMRDNPNPPPVVLTDFELFNKSVAIGGKESPLKTAINVADELTLRHGQSVFTFKFAALNYTAPEKNRYAYKLEGFDNDWRYTDSKRRFATYTSLPSGHYIFRVKASNNDGLWNERGASLKLIILPPWWATWWFRSLAAIVLLSLMAAGFHWRIQSITRRAAKLEVEVAQRTRSLSERTAELQAANKELEAFSYSISHDLRAPLRAIDGFSRILLEDYRDKLDDEGKDNLQRVRTASQRMGQLIDDMLQLSRHTRSEMHCGQVDLSALARAIVDELKVSAPQRQVEFVIEPGLTAHADAGLLQAVLQNLLDNAWKFTSQQPAAKIEFGRTIHEGVPIFFVRDNGIGFNMAYADKLFGAFQRLHSATEYPGTGIGLATVQRIIQRHGGQVWAESQVGHGATFYFSLPPAA
jgi:signal transduction histidine kinase/ligand-binding sensor domain-containing protein